MSDEDTKYIYIVRILMKNGPIQGKYDDIEFKNEEESLKYKNRIEDTSEYVGYYKRVILK